jgi:hypothetical protein
VNQEAQLTILLTLKDQVSGGISGVESGLSRLTSQSSMTGRALGTIETGAKNAWNNVKNLAGSLAMVGAAGGLLSVAGLLKSSIDDTAKFGQNVLELTKFTGESAESLSTLAAAMQATGVDSDAAQKTIGMMSKMIGAMTPDKQAAFETQYGLSLKNTTVTAAQLTAALDTLKNKKATLAQTTAAQTVVNDYNTASYKSTNDMIMQAADYYNNDLIPAEDKAAGLAKIFGRGWQTLIPLFSQGAQGITDLEKTASDMGMTITTQNLPAIQAMKDANEKWSTSVNALKIQIGLALMPAITQLATGMTDFVQNHSAEIVNFFKSAAGFAGDLGGVITRDVIPAFTTIAGWWGSLPGPLKDLLIGGFAASKLTGIGPMDLAKVVTGGVTGGGGAGGVAGGILGVQKVFVTNMGAGGMGGGATSAAGGSGLLGKVAILGSVLIAGASIAALAETFQGFQQQVGQGQATTSGQIADWKALPTSLNDNTAALNAEIAAYQKNTDNPLTKTLTDTFANTQTKDAMTAAADKLASGVTITPEGLAALRSAMETANNNPALFGAVQQLAADYKKGLALPQTTQAAAAQATALSKLAATIPLLDPSRQPPPVVNVTVNTTVTARDVTTMQDHKTWYGPAGRNGMVAM